MALAKPRGSLNVTATARPRTPRAAQQWRAAGRWVMEVTWCLRHTSSGQFEAPLESETVAFLQSTR